MSLTKYKMETLGDKIDNQKVVNSSESKERTKGREKIIKKKK